jgi:hypothetical protein
MKKISEDGRDPFSCDVIANLVPTSRLVTFDEGSNLTWTRVTNVFHDGGHDFSFLLLASSLRVPWKKQQYNFTQAEVSDGSVTLLSSTTNHGGRRGLEQWRQWPLAIESWAAPFRCGDGCLLIQKQSLHHIVLLRDYRRILLYCTATP